MDNHWGVPLFMLGVQKQRQAGVWHLHPHLFEQNISDSDYEAPGDHSDSDECAIQEDGACLVEVIEVRLEDG